MGFHKLVLVGGADTEANEARQMAVAARDVMDAAQRTSDLAEAIEGSVLVAAMSKRSRARVQPRPIMLRSAVDQILDVASIHPVSILFGNEKWGLSREELEPAGLIVKLPTNPDFGSLNLAQAVLLVAYELRMRLLNEGQAAAVKLSKQSRKLANAEFMEDLYAAAEEALLASGFFPSNRAKNGMSTLRGILSRAQLEEREVRFLFGVFGRLAHPHQRVWEPRKRRRSMAIPIEPEPDED